LSDCKFLFLASPSQTVRGNLKKIPKKINSKFVICCKGVEKGSNKLMHQVLKELFPKNGFAILSGPNFAAEVIKGLPTASVLSSKSNKILDEVSSVISSKKFRTYFNNDIVGTQIGGAMKNVIAIASGVIIGSNLGHNAGAAIITRGLSEIIDLGTQMGAKKSTFYGLSGIGDLTLTCSSLKSRNTKLGYLLAKGKSKTNQLFEGLESCESICKLGDKFSLELPICNAVKRILNGYDINKIVTSLLSRPLQFEK
jgi:glycerol-3-phosphate dehydrogenase (NAD(P)+)